MKTATKKKSTGRKTAARKKPATRKAAKKGAARKARTRKPTARKTSAARGAAKQPNARKPVTRKPVTRKTTTRKTGGKRRRQVVIDATNVLCGEHGQSRLELLLSMVVGVAGRGRDVLCIFDASTPHRLRSSRERDFYDWLLTDKSHYFVQCPGRTEADLLILAEADRTGSSVVSNDFFRDREARYPWVRDANRVLRHQPIRDVIYLDDVALPVETDLRALRADLARLLP